MKRIIRTRRRFHGGNRGENRRHICDSGAGCAASPCLLVKRHAAVAPGARPWLIGRAKALEAQDLAAKPALALNT